MPSIPDLPEKNAALVDNTAINALYRKATGEYVSRRFDTALQTVVVLQRHSSTLKAKRRAFLLYLAILDASAKDEPENSVLTTCKIWDEAVTDFQHDVPHDVYVHLIVALSRHTKDIADLQARVEELLTSTDPESEQYDEYSELYALHVLPRSGEWDAARGFIEAADMSDERKSKWIDTLAQIRTADDEAKRRKEQDILDAKRAESDAKKLKKVRKARASKKSSNNGSTNGSTIIPGSNSEPESPIIAKPPPTSVIQRWTQTLNVQSNTTILRVLFFLALLFGAAGRRAIRERIQRAFIATGRTIAAALKTTYI